jgi:RNA polymerase sigma-70 factor, ECF subfamily
MPESADQAAGQGRGTSLTLLQRLRDNDAGAWDRLVHLYSPLVKYWCARGGVGSPDADDVTQEVFKAVATGLARFQRDRPGDTFRGWLYGITRNVLLMHVRRANRQPRAAGGTGAWRQLEGVEDGAAPVDDESPATELNGLYRRALELVRGEFEERTWQAFWLNVVEGRAPADIAAEMGVTSAAVRKAKSRVLHRLKEELGDVIA